VEAGDPAKAVPCAERLAALMPGAGHLVHMPAHVYIRVGRYADAIELNHHATDADSVFSAGERPSLVYSGLYIPHNHHFLGFAAMLAGNARQAIESGRQTVAHAPVEALKQMPDFQPMLAFEQTMLLKFGRFDEVLQRPVPGPEVPVARATALHHRGTALAATGRAAEAATLVDSIAALGRSLPDGIAKQIVQIAAHSLHGEVSARSNKLDEAELHFRAAMEIEDGLMYMEPPWWIEPVRHALGALLLEAGKARQAEALYREDLKRFPRNGWALYGLWQSLKAQGSREAAAVEAEFREAWKGADVELTRARY
jgi:tetratricopeptide (TPR) repeat protein